MGARNRKPEKAENSGGNIVFCTNCGSKLPEGARFCSTCGARVAEVFEVPEVEKKPAAFGFNETAPDPETVKPVEAPLKKRATFDWSNVIDEPKKKTIPDIKSPWEATGSVDESELYSEMGTSTERSRTMSFIDVLKAEKEQQDAMKEEASAPAEPAPAAPAVEEKRPFVYTEVLDPDYLEPVAPAAEEKEEEAPQLHFAPLYEDVDAPVVTPFDIPEEEDEAVPADEVQIEETVQAEAPAEEAPVEEVPEAPEAPAEEPAAEIQIEETVAEEAPAAEETVEEAVEEAVEAAVAEEPAAEVNIEAPAPVEEEPVKPRRGWFDLPDFLKPKEERRPFAAFTEEEPEEIPAAPAEEPAAEVTEAPVEEVVFEEPEFDDAAEPADEIQIEAPEYEPEAKLEDELDSILKGGSGLMGHEHEEAEEAAEEAEEEIFEGDLYSNTEDEYLDISTERTESVRGAAEEVEDDDDEDEDEPVDEQELFADMTENAPKHTGMTIAPPADKETEIEALKKRLAELMGTSWEPEAEAEPEAEKAAPEAPAEEHVEQDYYYKDPEPAAEPVVETPAYEEYDHADFTQYEEPASTAAYEDEYLVEEPAAEAVAEEAPAVEEAAEEASVEEPSVYEHLILTPEAPVDEIPGAESKIIKAAETAAPAVVEEPAAEEPAVEDFYLMDEEPAEEVIFRAHEPAVVDEDEPVAEEPAVVAEEEPAVAAEEPVVEEAVEEVVEAAPAVEEVVEEPAPAVEEEPAHKTIDDFLAEILREGAAPAAASVAAEPAFEAPAAEKAVEEAVEAAPAVVEEPAVNVEDEYTDEVVLTAEDLEVPTFKEAPEAPELTLEDLTAPAAEEAVEAAPVVEEVVEAAPAVEEVAEAPAAEEVVEAAPAAEAPAPEKKETDALSIEELEQDLFGSSATPEAEVEATKKIDKFYTLYRKNEEFQRLLDEEYNKLKAAGGPVPEPALPDNEPEVKHKKIEDATIYQDFDLEKEAAKLRAEQEKAAEAAVEVKADAESAASAAPAAVAAGTAVAAGAAVAAGKKDRKAEKAAAKAAKAAEKAAAKEAKAAEKADLEFEEVEKGGGFLTVLAVIIAILLIILLGVILVLNFMPDSSLALRIDSIIENITSHFTAVDVMGKTLLL